MTSYRGTVGQLVAMRDAWRHLDAAARTMVSMQLPGAAEQRAKADELGAVMFNIPTPCMFCRVDQPFWFRVGDPDNALPNTLICGDCGARIEEEMEELNRRQPGTEDTKENQS